MEHAEDHEPSGKAGGAGVAAGQAAAAVEAAAAGWHELQPLTGGLAACSQSSGAVEKMIRGVAAAK